MDIKCPICNKKFDYNKGLAGHLKFKHKLTGEAFRKAYREGGIMPNDKGIKTAKQQSQLNLINNLHTQLREVREGREDVKERLNKDDWFTTDKAAENLIKLYDREEKRIQDEIKTLLGTKTKKGFWESLFSDDDESDDNKSDDKSDDDKSDDSYSIF